MIKILLLAIAIWLVIVVLKNYRTNLDRRPDIATHNPPEKMVQCAHCGVHLPTSDSLIVSGQYYCCEAHALTPPADDNRQ